MSALESKFESLVDALVPLASMAMASRAQVLAAAEVLRYRRGDLERRDCQNEESRVVGWFGCIH